MMESQQCSTLLLVSLCVCFVTGLSAERIERKREGDKVIIPCSIDQVNQDGMYLYKNYHQRHEATYLTSKMQSSPRVAFANRIQVAGVFTQPIVTITNLTIDDTGVYWCQYLRYEGPKQYPTPSKDDPTLLVVSGLEVCPTPSPSRHLQSQDDQMSTMLVVTGITVFSLALIVFIILIIGVKHCYASKGKYSPGPQSGGDPDYEQMSPQRDPPMSQMRPQRDTSMSQSSGLVLINPAYAAYPNST